MTARDNLTIRWSPEEVWETVRVFAHMAPELARQSFALGSDAHDWKVTLAQKDLRSSELDRANIVPVLYRPFDVRYTYYTGRSRGFICRPRPEVMRHMLAGENVALLTPRRVEHVGIWRHAFLSTTISEHVAVSLKTIDYHFPLYRYPDAECHDLFAPLGTTERQPNLNAQIVAALAAAHGHEPTPEAIFFYVYAILYAPAYREKYAALLRLDFPRIPLTSDKQLFDKLAALGSRLADLHLLRAPELDPPLARFEGAGDGRVAKGKSLRYDEEARRIYVNETMRRSTSRLCRRRCGTITSAATRSAASG